jgi:hypothetical protein
MKNMIQSLRYPAKQQSGERDLQTSLLSRSLDFVRSRFLLIYLTSVEILYMFYK